MENIETLDESTYRRLCRSAEFLLRREKPEFRLEAADLVHEAILRIAAAKTPVLFNDRTHLVAVANLVMRRVLIDRARSPSSARRKWTALDEELGRQEMYTAESLALRNALEQLAELNRRRYAVVRMRFYWGLDFGEIASALSVSSRTAKRDWREARKWLREEIGRPAAARPGFPPCLHRSHTLRAAA